ncbi:MAG: 16S rRNA (cytosine(967)-C(5))-methyltransferase, partial [Gammaproteobacteria bacterium]|nr:16S rRNA (cytosine(967)-C(5))-methyltransferase [Gammaproteobacteria bacterium]
TATGVIRRHPDIKLLRKAGDIDPLVRIQQRILRATWPLLKPGGILLYTTCSLLPEENHLQVASFLETQKDARERVIDAEWGHVCSVGRQTLPGENTMDGFYYACLEKC